MQEILVDGQLTLLVSTREEYDEAFATGLPIQPTAALAKLLGFPYVEDGHDSAETELDTLSLPKSNQPGRDNE